MTRVKTNGVGVQPATARRVSHSSMLLNLKWLDEELAANKAVGPGFHFLRHALSLIILTHHCRIAVFGVKAEPEGDVKGAPITEQLTAHLSPGLALIELLRPGLFALVGLFFALSDFLVFASATRTKSIKMFFGNRALRLLPALSVETALSALILGPLVTEIPLGAYFTDSELFRYFGNIVGEVAFVLPGVFVHNPWPKLVNANLWTLPPELACYLLMLAMLALGMTKKRRQMAVLAITALVVFQLIEIIDPTLLPARADSTHFNSWFIVFLFVLGAAFFANADLVPLHPKLFLAAAGVYWSLLLMNVLHSVAAFFLTYCMALIGMTSFRWFDRFVKMDLSYGTYLYGFPLTQGVVYFLQPVLSGYGVFTQYLIILPIVVVGTTIFAAGSWVLIEKPALNLRRHLIREPSPHSGGRPSEVVSPGEV